MSKRPPYPLRGEDIEIRRNDDACNEETEKFNIRVSPRLHALLMEKDWVQDDISQRFVLGYSITEDELVDSETDAKCP